MQYWNILIVEQTIHYVEFKFIREYCVLFFISSNSIFYMWWLLAYMSIHIMETWLCLARAYKAVVQK